ncbi:hypothetical protein [Nocardia sp. R7R-8]|uniref:hypothetical protein n=1 Tax=Nocardia sp. R7R-8 TaxID=3459304 RepID=UPI00403E0C21
MHRSNRHSPDLFSHRTKPAETSTPEPGVVRPPVFSDIAATSAVAMDETTLVDADG